MKKITLAVAALFTAAGLSAQMAYELGPDFDAVSVDLGLFASDPNWVGFPTQEEGTIIYIQSSFEETDTGFVWRGRLPGQDLTSALIISDGEGFYGSFGDYDAQRYKIHATPDGVDLRPIVHETYGHLHQHLTLWPDNGVHHEAQDRIQRVSSASTDEETRSVDVLVLYTEAANTQYGTYWQDGWDIPQNMDWAAQGIKDVFKNSGVANEINFVHVQQMPESYDPSSIDPEIEKTCNGWYDDGVCPNYTRRLIAFDNDDILALRKQHDADIVLGVLNETAVCGLAWARRKGNTLAFVARWSHAYVSVGNRRCGQDFEANIAHEIGHIMGAYHDKANLIVTDSDEWLFPYAFGYCRWPVRTQMAECTSPRTKKPYFSMAKRDENNWRMGEAGKAENGRVLQQTAPQTATFSDLIKLPPPVIVDPPAAPTNLRGVVRKVSGKWRVSLYWTDNARNEDAYVVKYGRTKRNKQPVEDPFVHEHVYPNSTHPNMSTALILNLQHRKEYAFKVQAVNAGGVGESETIKLKMK